MNKIVFFCPTCQKQIPMPKIGCGCSKNIKYFCSECRKAYPEHRLERKKD